MYRQSLSCLKRNTQLCVLWPEMYTVSLVLIRPTAHAQTERGYNYYYTRLSRLAYYNTNGTSTSMPRVGLKVCEAVSATLDHCNSTDLYTTA